MPAGSAHGGQWTEGGSTRTQPVTKPEPAPVELVRYEQQRPGREYSYQAESEKPTPLPKLATVAGPKGEPVDRINIFIGGLDDEKHGNVKDSPILDEIYGNNYYAPYKDEDDGGNAISHFIETLPKEKTINLIGHSYGGDTAAKVAKKYPGRINLLVTIDPTSWSSPDLAKVRKSVKKWINVNARLSDGTGGNFLAGIGGSWDKAPEDYAHIFINAPFNHKQFAKMIRNAVSKESLSAKDILNQDAIPTIKCKYVR